MPLGGSGGGAAGPAEAQNAKRDVAIAYGMQAINKDFSTFTPEFYDKAATDYTNYATPEVMQQYQNTKNSLGAALARNGILNSSASATEGASLDKELNTNLGTVANRAQDQANKVRGNVSSQKNQLVSQLEASADPSLAATGAASAVAGLQAPSALQPIGNLFSDWTSTYLANQNAMAYNPNQPSIWSLLGAGGGGQGGSGGSSVMVP